MAVSCSVASAGIATAAGERDLAAPGIAFALRPAGSEGPRGRDRDIVTRDSWTFVTALCPCP